MPYGQKLVGKREVMPWLIAGAASEKEPKIINDVAANDWGVFEYVGTATRELIEFAEFKDGRSHRTRAALSVISIKSHNDSYITSTGRVR